AAGLERQCIEEMECKIGNFARQLTQLFTGQTNHHGSLRSDRGPHADSPEDVRAAYEVSGKPIGERYLTSRRRGVEASDEAALHQQDAVLILALREQHF